LLSAAACGALSAALVYSSALGAAPPVGQAESAPWVITNGQPNAGLYVPRDIQQAYAKGTRSPDRRPGPNDWQNHAKHTIRIAVELELVTNGSMSPSGILGIAAAAAIVVFVVFLLVGIHAPMGHAMPRIRNFG
jgi:hypothetical protein